MLFALLMTMVWLAVEGGSSVFPDSPDALHSYRRRMADKWMWGFENDSFPFGHSLTGRIAILLTGQLRSANLTWLSVRDNANSKMFGPSDPPTTAMTIVEWLFKPLARKHPVDVFMYLTAHPGHSNEQWDGSPLTYEPAVGDMRGCEVFSANEVFSGTGNRFFCLVEDEVQLMNAFILSYPWWGHYYTNRGPPPQMKEQALQQLYGMYRANLAAKQHALATGVQYEYKIRLRPDIALVRPFSDLSVFDFSAQGGMIYYSNPHIYHPGNEDFFNIGRAVHMDPLLDRYLDFISLPLLTHGVRDWFIMEEFLVATMSKRYNISMAWHADIWLVVIRVTHHSINTWLPPVNPNQWRDLSSDNSTTSPQK